MTRPSIPIKLLNSTSGFTAIINTVIGLTLLPLTEFVYNNALNATTSVSPFFANKGYNPNFSIHPEQDLISSHTCDFVADLDELH